MTCIVNFKTKKEMKEAISAGEDFLIEDPSIFNPRTFRASDMHDGDDICVTNHPKRSWFAAIKKVNGQLKVS